MKTVTNEQHKSGNQDGHTGSKTDPGHQRKQPFKVRQGKTKGGADITHDKENKGLIHRQTETEMMTTVTDPNTKTSVNT